MRKDHYLFNLEKQGVMLGYSANFLAELKSYAETLLDRDLPVIFDQNHLSLLLGIDNEYLHRMSNAPKRFYRTYYIKKKAKGKLRRIDEPLPDLLKTQRWILDEILYHLPISRYAKAYKPHSSVKENARFHKRQSKVLTIDIKDYFPSISIGRVIKLFRSIGYTDSVSILLANLCCLNKSLPQGAPTSPCLSNLVTKNIDNRISDYCKSSGIRYTRYADDMTFSGDFHVGSIISYIDNVLRSEGFRINQEKVRLRERNNRQEVTGIVVNEKPQVCREYRHKIRQEVYYISKYGLDSHIEHENITKARYLQHLVGRINYMKFINPNDRNAIKYMSLLEPYIKEYIESLQSNH